MSASSGRREVFQGHDGSLRVALRPGEGEFVCPACDVIQLAPRKPASCSSCGHDRMETLTAVQPAAWQQGWAELPKARGEAECDRDAGRG